MRASFMNETPSPANRLNFAPWQFGLLLAALILAAFPQVVFGLETFVARDYGFFVYPLAHFQKECVWQGELPFWNPYNNCGVPFLAQWNTMPLYPPSLLYLAFPLNWSLSFFSLLHLWFAGMGMFFLARRWTGNSFAAAFAGVAFGFNGFTINLLMWPSHIATFSWLPWVVLAVECAWREGGKKIPLAAFVGTMQMLAGGPETIFLTWLLLAGLWLQQFVLGESPRAAMLWRFPLVVVLVFSLSAAQLLPFLDLVSHAQRETGYTDLRWSMPGFGLANFLVPMAFGSTITEGIFFQHGQAWTSSYYLGLGTLWLALVAIFGVCDRRVKMLAAVTVIALLCALGENTPFYPLVRKIIPQLSFITYPVKFVMLVVFAGPLLAAFALANLEASRKKLLPVGATLLVLIGAIIVWTQAAPLAGDETHAALLNGLSRVLFLLVTGAVLFALMRSLKSSLHRYLPLLLILAGWLDVFTHEPKQNPTLPPGIFDLNLVRNQLAMNPQPDLGGSRAMLSAKAALELTQFAVHDPKDNFLAKRVGLCANVNLLDAIPKVDGFFSLTPREFDLLLSTIYSAGNGKWTQLENFMGVSQTTSATNILNWEQRAGFQPLITIGQQPVFLDATNTIWTLGRNDFDATTTVFLPPESKSFITASNQPAAKILDAKFGINTVDFKTESPGPAVAAIAQSYYHNWAAEVDGQPVPLVCANAAFQTVQVPGGSHQVHLFYHDRAFEIGAAISLCMWVNCFVSYVALRRRELPASPVQPDEDDYF